MKFNANQLRILCFLHKSRVNSNGVSGVEISKAIRVGVATVYPFLAKLVHEEMAIFEWEDIRPTEEGRPRKKFYRLTGKGVGIAELALGDFQIGDSRLEGIPEPGGGLIHG